MVVFGSAEQLKIPFAEKVQRFLNERNLQNLEVGKYELGDGCYVAVSEYESKQCGEIVYEAHRAYLDIQFLLYGKESIFLTDKNSAVCTREYDFENDYALYASEKGDEKILKAGELMVLYPEDLHSPCHATDDIPCKVKKFVFKIVIKG